MNHVADDVYIPIRISQNMLNKFRTAGVPESKMEMVTIAGFDHPGGIISTGVNAVLWFLEF